MVYLKPIMHTMNKLATLLCIAGLGMLVAYKPAAFKTADTPPITNQVFTK